MTKLFGYAPQRTAVLAILEDADMSWRGIHWITRNNILPMRGMEGACFVNVMNHPDQPPPEALECIRAYGFITMDLSDQHLRARKGAAA